MIFFGSLVDRILPLPLNQLQLRLVESGRGSGSVARRHFHFGFADELTAALYALLLNLVHHRERVLVLLLLN